MPHLSGCDPRLLETYICADTTQRSWPIRKTLSVSHAMAWLSPHPFGFSRTLIGPLLHFLLFYNLFVDIHLRFMESQKLDTGLFIRIHSETIEKLKAKAKKDRRKLAEFVRLLLEDVANG